MFLLKSRFEKSIKAITSLLICGVFSYVANGADQSIKNVLKEYDFSKMTSRFPWGGWSQNPQKIAFVKTKSGQTVLQYTGEGWNTPILPLTPPITVTATTALQFRVKTANPGRWEINLQNATEGAEYSIFFSVKTPNKWTNITAILRKAAYKRGGKTGIKKDGIVGDKISRIQLAYYGKNIQLAEFNIVELNLPRQENVSGKLPIIYDFNKMTSHDPWIGWSLKPQKINLVKIDGKTVLQYIGESWNTPMLPLNPPIIITATTALQFRIKNSNPGSWEINLQNTTEGAEYSMPFSVLTPNKWTDITVVLKDAAYKRGGKPGIKKDGIIGDKISRIQLAFNGKNIQLAEFKIVELDASSLSEVSITNPVIKAYKDTYNKVNYPKLARNSVFPFGVIVTLSRGCRDNAEFFDQTLLDRYKAALLDIKLRGFNTVSNFCNSVKTGDNLELMKKFHLYLLDTVTCGGDVHELPDSAPLIRDVKKYSFHPNLLAWYGQDEPTNIEKYLKNKKRIETISAGGSPYVSAMHMNYIVKNVGPCMEVIVIDPYNLTDDFNAKKSRQSLLNHSSNIELARNSSVINRVWMIPQAFGMRNSGRRTLRIPRPEEVRLEVFNALASGVKGFIFFIYNESVPYLDKQIRGEEFDQTMVDAWYNGNPMTDELSKLAKRLIPVIPSFLDVVPGKDLKIKCNSKDTFVEQWKNQYGTLIYCYNTNLVKNTMGQLYVKLPDSLKLYDVESLKVVDYNKLKFNLAPGDGRILLAATPQKFAVIAKEINFRRAEFAWQQLDVKLKKLTAAGFDTVELQGKLKSLKPETDKAVFSLNAAAKKIINLRISNAEFCEISDKLEDIQKTFGRINAILTASHNIRRIDHNPRWYDVFDSIRQLGTEYFKYRSFLDNGKLSEIPANSLNRLETKVRQLEKEVTNKIN